MAEQNENSIITEELTEERRMELERFVETEDSGEVISVPQCVGCRYNDGARACGALAEKPVEFMMNEQECPMREEVK